MELRQTYEKLKTKYKLPGFDEINTLFDIEDISGDTSILLQKIRVKMVEKIETYTNLIENLIQPDTNLKNMYETKYLSDRARENAFVVFKKMMHIVRSSELCGITNTEEENAKFINFAFEKCKETQPQVTDYLKKLNDIWQKETNPKEDLGYFG